MQLDRKIILGISIITGTLSLAAIFLTLHIDIIIKEDLPLFENKNFLSKEEFNIYNEDSAMLEISKIEAENVDYSNNDFALISLDAGEELFEQCFDFNQSNMQFASPIATKRNICIGDSVDDVINAYMGLECLLIDIFADIDYMRVEKLRGHRYTKNPRYSGRTQGSYILRFTSCYKEANRGVNDEFFGRRYLAFVA